MQRDKIIFIFMPNLIIISECQSNIETVNGIATCYVCRLFFRRLDSGNKSKAADSHPPLSDLELIVNTSIVRYCAHRSAIVISRPMSN